MLMKLNNNFFFRKRVIKNKQIKLVKTNKISKKLKFKQVRLKQTKFKKLFDKTTWKLFNHSVRKVLKKRLKNKKNLKIFLKKRFNFMKKKGYILPKNIFNNDISFSFKWKSKPIINFFNQKVLVNFIIISSEKNIIQNYDLNVYSSYSFFYKSISKSFDVWLTLKSNFFKNYLTIYNQIFLNNSVVYKNTFFTNNKLPLINSKFLKHWEKKNINPLFKSFKSFSKFLNLISKQLPYVELVRSFRENLKRKVISYDINVVDFFKTVVLRVNQDSKNYKMNIIKYNKIYKIFKVIGLLKTYDCIKIDNVFESNFDTNLSKPFSIDSFKKKISTTSLINFKKPSNITKVKNNFINTFDTSLILLRSVDLLFNFFGSVILYKYLIFNNNLFYFNYSKNINKNNNLAVINDLNKYFFNSRINVFNKSNLIPSNIFKYVIKRKLLKIVNFDKFSSNIIMWYYNILIRFMENCSGRKVYLKFNPFIENSLSFNDIARCNMWSIRITSFQRLLGPKIFLKESLKILHIAIKFKDPTFLSNWIKSMLYRMSFWKYRLLFRYLKFTMRYLFWLYFPELEFKGFKLRLKGKISVAGNARTRTLLYKIGETSYSKFNNRIVSDFTTINTFTGVLGFKIWFFF